MAATDAAGNPSVIAAGELIEAAWGNANVNHVVKSFASAAQRDSLWTSPPNGAMCVTTDSNTLWQRIAGAWSPRGAGKLLASAGLLGSGGFLTTMADIPALTINPVVPVGARRLELMLTAHLQFSGGAPGTATMHMTDNANAAFGGLIATLTNGYVLTVTTREIVNITGTGVAVPFKVRAMTNVTVMNLANTIGTTYTCVDLGPP